MVPFLETEEKNKIGKYDGNPYVPKLGTHTSNPFSMFHPNGKTIPVGIVSCYSLCLCWQGLDKIGKFWLDFCMCMC